MSKIEYCYSFNEEDYQGSFSTRDEAIEEAIFEHPCVLGLVGEPDELTFYVALVSHLSAADFLGGDVGVDLIDRMRESAFERVGEYSEGFLFNADASTLQRKIEAAVNQWATEGQEQPAFTGVRQMEKVTVRALFKDEYTLQEWNEV